MDNNQSGSLKKRYRVVKVIQLVIGLIALLVLLNGKIVLGFLLMVVAAISRLIAGMIAATFYDRL